MDWSSFILLVSNVLLATLTGVYVVLTRQLVRSQTDPHVIVFVAHDTTRATVLQIVVRNVGRGVAKEIKFALSRSIPKLAPDPRWNPGFVVEEMSDGPLLEGIPALAPQEERRIDWGQYKGLEPILRGEPVFVTCAFTVSDRRRQSTHNILEVRSFAASPAVDTDGARLSAKQIQRIADLLNERLPVD